MMTAKYLITRYPGEGEAPDFSVLLMSGNENMAHVNVEWDDTNDCAMLVALTEKDSPEFETIDHVMKQFTNTREMVQLETSHDRLEREIENLKESRLELTYENDRLKQRLNVSVNND